MKGLLSVQLGFRAKGVNDAFYHPWWIPNHQKLLYPTDMLQSEFGDIYCLKIIQGKMEL